MTVIGVIAVLVTAWWVPADSGAARGSLRREVRAVTRLPVLLGLLMTTLGFGSMFTVYTYIQPLLTGITGFGETAVAPNLASSLNIGAFNLGNAFGAWLGSAVLTHGPGLTGLPWIATLVPISALLVAAWAIRRQRGEVTTAEPGCRTAA